MFDGVVVAVVVVIVSVALLILLEPDQKTNAPRPKWSLPWFHETWVPFFLFHRLDDWAVEQMRQLGLTFTIKMMGQPRLIVINDPANLEHVLKTNFDNYIKGTFWGDRVTDLLGHGIFNSDGARWKSQRKITSNLFNVKTFRDNIHLIMEQHVHHLVNIVEKSILNKTAVDINATFHRFTLDSIAQIAFGYDLGSLQDKDVPFARAWDRSNAIVVRRFFTPSLFLNRWFSSDEWFITKDLKVISDFTQHIIDERKHEEPSSIAARGDLLSLFMSRTDDEGQPFSEQFLKDMVSNTIIAGRDTTAESLCWTIYLLALNPDKLKKVQQELDEVLGDEPISYDIIHENRLRYLYATITESLRLYPSVPRDPKMAVNDDVLPDGTTVPKGANVAYYPYVMGRSEKLWGQDCLQFKPERFIDDLHPSQYKFSAFQGGYRRCLGVDLAYHEEQVVLATLLQKYDVALVPGQDIRMIVNLTAVINGPVNIKFSHRKQ